MEQVAKCKSLVAIFRDDKKMLDGPHAVGFDIEKDKAFHIDVEQCGIRKISITSDVDVSVFDLYALFSRIERLLMLFVGAFISFSDKLTAFEICSIGIFSLCKFFIISFFSFSACCAFFCALLILFSFVICQLFQGFYLKLFAKISHLDLFYPILLLPL